MNLPTEFFPKLLHKSSPIGLKVPWFFQAEIETNRQYVSDYCSPREGQPWISVKALGSGSDTEMFGVKVDFQGFQGNSL